MNNKTIVITGGSQGIGKAIALKFAQFKGNLVILTKDSPANIEEASQQIIKAGGQIFIQNIDVRDFTDMQQAIQQAVNRFGGIDILINNTSATCFANLLHMLPEQFDLVISTSVRAAFFLSQICFPYLKESSNPHIINISPPLNMEPHWFKNHLAFTIAKYAMSMCTLGLSEEFKQAGIAVNSLWPQTTIATQTIKAHFLPKVYISSRWPSIMADAAHVITQDTVEDWTGQFFIDEVLLRKTGITDFSPYAVSPQEALMQPLFIPLEEDMIPISEEFFISHQT